MLVPAFVLRPERGHARLRMEVEDSGGVVLTAYHSYARSQPPSSEPRCAPRATTSHPGSRYPDRLQREQRFPGLGLSFPSCVFCQGIRAPSLDCCFKF